MISERLQAFIEHLGLTSYQFEKVIGASKNSISIPIKNNTTVGSEILGKIFNSFPEINLAWLITGAGEMLNSTKPIQQTGDVVIKSGNDSGNESKRKYSLPHEGADHLTVREDESPYLAKASKGRKGIEVDIIDVRAAANFTGVSIAQDYPEILGTLSLPTTLLKSGKHLAFPIIGDSMEPTLYSGDYIVGRLIEKGDYQLIKDYFIYIVVTRDGIVVKRLLNRLKERGQIRCRSDNRKFSAYNIEEDDIINIFQAKAKLSFNFSNEQANLFDMYHELEERIETLEIKSKNNRK